MADEQVKKPRARSVVDGVLKQLSISQINTFWDKGGTSKEGCNRRWYFGKVMRMPEPQTAAQELGTRIHSQIEHYLKTGENGLGKEALPGLIHLPPPKAPTLAEYPLEDAGEWMVDGVRFTGSIDALDPRDPTRPHLYDWKSTSGFEWAKSSEQWKLEIQQIVYTKRIADLFPDAKEFPWTAVYFRTQGAPKALPVRIVSTLTEANDRWLTVRRLISDIQTVAGLDSPAKVKPNTNACWAFRRRCPHAAECSKYQQTKEEKIMAFADRLRAQLATDNTAPAAVPAPAVPAPAPVASPAPKKLVIEDQSTGNDEELRQALQAKEDVARERVKLGKSFLLDDGRTVEVVEIDGISFKGRVGTNVGWSIQGLITGLGAETARVAPAVLQTAPPASPAPILAPDAPKSNPELAAVCPYCPEDGKIQQHTKDECPTLKKQAEASPTAQPGAAAAPTEEEKPKRTRRTKAEMEAARAAEAAPVPSAPTAPVVQESIQAAGSDVAATIDQTVAEPAPRETMRPDGFALFVNALPLGVGLKESTEYVESILAKVNEAAAVPDYRLVDYGKGAGLLAACAREFPPKISTLILITRESAAAAIIADALAPLARYVVRGV
jgi:hypothetical protein